MDYINTVKAIVVLGSAVQMLAPRSINDYTSLTGFYFEIQPFGICSFNIEQYRSFKLNTLYLLLQASYLKKKQRLKLDIHSFVSFGRIAIHILIECKFLDNQSKDFIDEYVCDIIDEFDEFINGFPNWIKVTELAQHFRTVIRSNQKFTLSAVPKTARVNVH